jgi:hypothetical protein
MAFPQAPRCPGPHGYGDSYLSRMVETIRPVVEGMTAAGYADRLCQWSSRLRSRPYCLLCYTAGVLLPVGLNSSLSCHGFPLALALTRSCVRACIACCSDAYGFDESWTGQLGCDDIAPSVYRVFGAIKTAFPNLTTVSAGFGYKAWGHTPPLDLPLDVWVEDYFTFCWNDTMSGASPAAQKDCLAKQEGVSAWRKRHGYWWYWAGAPRPGPNGVPDGRAVRTQEWSTLHHSMLLLLLHAPIKLIMAVPWLYI